MARFGIQLADFRSPQGDADLFERASAAALAAEDAGFDSAWVMDHFHQLPPFMDRADPMPEAYSMLAALAARTTRLRLGALVTGVTYRNPALLAKTVTTLDVISGGRAVLGLGASWQEDEYVAYGFGRELPGVKERLDRLEDALIICRAMFDEPSAHHAGTHHRVTDALNVPRPVQPGGPPILIGGGGEKRLLRLVARYGDMCNLFGDPDTVRHKLAVLDRHCADVGRDPSEISRSHLGGVVLGETDAEARERAEALVSAGLPRDMVDGFFMVGGPETLRARVGEYLDAGLDTMLFLRPGSWDPESVGALGRALAPLTDGP